MYHTTEYWISLVSLMGVHRSNVVALQYEKSAVALTEGT